MPNVHLTVATWDYDHCRDLRIGEVRPVGIDVTYLDLNMHEIFTRFLAHREWDVTELSFAKFLAEASGPESDLIALPVFLRREFRYGMIYVNRNRIRKPEDLRGKQMAIPEWAQTACVYIRGALQHDFGIPLTEIEWLAGWCERSRTHRKGRDGPAQGHPSHRRCGQVHQPDAGDRRYRRCDVRDGAGLFRQASRHRAAVAEFHCHG